MKPSGPPIVFVLSVAALSVALGLAGWRAQSLIGRVLESRQSLAECRRLSGQIAAARRAPQTASDTQEAEGELARRIEAWAKRSGVAPKQVIRIDPLSPRRVGDSDYLIQGAELEIEGLTLPQLSRFSAAVWAEDKRLRIARLRLSTPRTADEPDAGAEPWRGEFALTYLLHSPKSVRRR